MKPIIALWSICLLACDGRSLQISTDGGSSPDIAIKSSDGSCTLPQGLCYNRDDCAGGMACVGCQGDPCCPMCSVCVGRCVPEGSCYHDAECAKGSYCRFPDGACKGQGICAKKPAACPDGISPVCGCDGTAYPSLCEAALKGTSLGQMNTCKASCTTLNQSYTQAVWAAKSCCADCNSVQCTHQVMSALQCGCPTRVNTTAKVKPLAAEWGEKGCEWVLPCTTGGACAPAKGAVCGNDGRCKDLYY